MREAKNCPKCDVELRDERFCNICGWRQIAAKTDVSITAQPQQHRVVAQGSATMDIRHPEEVRECECCRKEITIGGFSISSCLFYKTEEGVFCSQVCFVKFIARQEAIKVVMDSKNVNWVTLLDLSNDKQPRLYIPDPPDIDEEPKSKE